jgi:hypothetical protein
MMQEHVGWIGLDLDGTVAEYGEWEGPLHIGNPIPKMVDRVKIYLSQGYEFKIFTARVAEKDDSIREQIISTIQDWCLTHLGQCLEVTNIKDYDMLELWDDRAVQVEKNTGHFVGKSTRGFI